ncbi:hypothetical protein PFISCL1PPCAC_11742, partial [Pristionchus fissidentatus]
ANSGDALQDLNLYAQSSSEYIKIITSTREYRIREFRCITVEHAATLCPQFFSDISIVRDDFAQFSGCEKTPNMSGADIDSWWLVKVAEYCEATIEPSRLEQLREATDDRIQLLLMMIMDALDSMHARKTAQGRARHRLIYQRFTVTDPASAVQSLLFS